MTKEVFIATRIWEARRRKFIFIGCLTFSEALSLFLGMALLAILSDACLGLGLGVRLWLRFFLLFVSVAYFVLILVLRWRELSPISVIAQLQRHFARSFSHDALLNAWELSRREPLGFGAELKNKEINRAAEGLSLLKEKIFEPYRLGRFFARLGWVNVGSLLTSPLFILALPDATYRLARLSFPRYELRALLKNVEINPWPGQYQINIGDPITIQVTLKTPRPSYWGEPTMNINGEQYPLIALGGHPGESFIFSLPAVNQRFKMRLEWNEFVSDAWEIVPIRPPEITRFRVSLYPPSYTREPIVSLEKPQALSILEGTRLELDLKADRVLRREEIAFEQEGLRRRVGSVFIPQKSGVVNIALEDEEGRLNPKAWAMSLDVSEDNTPEIHILDPAFPEIQMDINEELPIFWQAQDDWGLEWVSLEIRGITTPQRSHERLIWKAQEEKIKFRQGSFVFKPKEWGLASGDQIEISLGAKDNYPERVGVTLAPEKLLVTLASFQEIHRENVTKGAELVGEEMLEHLQKGMQLQEGLLKKEPQGLKSDFDSYHKDSQKLLQNIGSYREHLEKDPLIDPKLAWGLRHLEETVGETQKTHLTAARDYAAQAQKEKTQFHLNRYLEELQKSLSHLAELKKEQKVFDTIDSASRLEGLFENLDLELNQDKELSEIQNILADIDRELTELVKTLSASASEVLPQEFVNEMREADLPLMELAVGRRALEEALKQGDKDKAKEVAKSMLEAIRKLRHKLSQANTNYQSKTQELPSIQERLIPLIEEQKEILAETSSLDMALKLRQEKNEEPLGLSDKERLLIQEEAIAEEALSQKTLGLLSDLAKIDREFPTLGLGSLVIKLETAVARQKEANLALRIFDLPGALEQESASLKTLEELLKDFKKLALELESLPKIRQQMGSSPSLILVPSKGRLPGGLGGFRLGRVAIPRRQDYEVRPEKREEILKALQEKMPKSVEPDAKRYLEGLLK